MPQSFDYSTRTPAPALADLVESTWRLVNTGTEQECVILPDGRVDIIFAYTDTSSLHAVLLGLDTTASKTIMAPGSIRMAVSFKLLAVEYFLRRPIGHLNNHAELLPDGFLGITADDLQHLDRFTQKINEQVAGSLTGDIDDRKRQLFRLIYAANGNITVQELSDKVFWSSRQINRYFNQWFGIPVKTYCNILRFRASFGHIREGKLFPEQEFTDQSHFIREVKKYAGVIPRDLARNENDRFIQFSTLPRR